ncbi:MAG: ribosome silencing factor [Deltaproteobacteria bacterium]|nr:ribosome silencing factor [Deltaproteobacteria bacterium]
MTPLTLAKQIAQAAHDKKAENITVLDLRKLSSFTDFFVIASGQSDRQVQAIAYNIEDELRKKGVRVLSSEGHTHGHWILMDYGSVVAHLFFEEDRSFYDLEKLWGDAKKVPLKLK